MKKREKSRNDEKSAASAKSTSRRVNGQNESRSTKSAASIARNRPSSASSVASGKRETAMAAEKLFNVLRLNTMDLAADDDALPDTLIPFTPRARYQINPNDVVAVAKESARNRIYEVNFSARKVAAIENLDSFTNLRSLDLSCNCIQQINNLNYNTKLRELKLYDNYISHVENIEMLCELQNLFLNHNRIVKIGRGLQNCKKLKQLRLDCNYIRALEVRDLAVLSQLTHLDLTLEELLCAGNKLTKINDLSRCTKLSELDVSHNKLKDIRGLKNMPCLATLRASHNALRSVKDLGRLRLLTELHLSNNHFSDVSYLHAVVPCVEILDLSHNSLETWEQIKCLQKLYDLLELKIGFNPFCDDDGPNPNYHHDVTTLIATLEYLDGAQVRRPKMTSSDALNTPLMRPMSANTVVNARQVEAKLRAMSQDLVDFETSFTSRFGSLKETMTSLPCVSPRDEAAMARSSRTGGIRSRLQQAKQYANENNWD